MHGDDKGFSLVELLVVMAITVFVLMATSKVLVSLISTFKQQSKIAESSIESVVGLEILRRDIQSAGFGLASGISNSVSTFRIYDWSSLNDYTEVVNPDSGDPNPDIEPEDFNDSDSSAAYYISPDPKASPRVFISAAPAWTVNGSDYLVLKGANLGSTAASGKYHTLEFGGAVNTWYPEKANPIFDANLRDTDYVLVISIRDEESVGLAEDESSAGTYYTRFDDLADFEPPDNREVRIVYGLDSDSVPVAPFNRADYYISSQEQPGRCAPNTGSLVKASMQHSTGKLGPEMPVLDCVADMQVLYKMDENEDGIADAGLVDSSVILTKTALQIKRQVKEVRVYILVHEGQADPRRKFAPDPANPPADPPTGADDNEILVGARSFDLLDNIGTTYTNYKWRVLRVIESPSAMR